MMNDVREIGVACPSMQKYVTAGTLAFSMVYVSAGTGLRGAHGALQGFAQSLC
jgi:hypothetical protein